MKKMLISLFLCMQLSLLNAANGSDSMNTHMNDQDQQNTGVHKLTPQEQKALQQWINTHHDLKNSNGSTNGNGTGSYLSDPKNLVDQAASVSQVMRAGAYVELTDNTLWEINPADRSITMSWISPVPIYVKPNQDQNYPYLLVNSVTSSKVRAKKVTSMGNESSQ